MKEIKERVRVDNVIIFDVVDEDRYFVSVEGVGTFYANYMLELLEVLELDFGIKITSKEIFLARHGGVETEAVKSAKYRLSLKQNK